MDGLPNLHIAIVLWGEADTGYPFMMARSGGTEEQATRSAEKWAEGHLVHPEKAEIRYMGTVYVEIT